MWGRIILAAIFALPDLVKTIAALWPKGQPPQPPQPPSSPGPPPAGKETPKPGGIVPPYT